MGDGKQAVIRLLPVELLSLAKTAAGIEYSKRMLRRSDWGVNSLASRIYALGAERAVAKALGCTHDPVVLPGGDGHVDLQIPVVTPFGKTIEVRFRRKRGGDLATQGLRFWEELVADVYVLVWPSEGQNWTPLCGYCVVGWATRDDFLRRIVSRPPIRMRGEKWEIPFSELRDFRVLVSLLRGRAEAARRLSPSASAMSSGCTTIASRRR